MVVVQDEIALFNGKDLSGWTVIHNNQPDPGWRNMIADPDRGELRCPPNAEGRLQTSKSYSKFLLTMEYLIPERGATPNRESGILLLPANDLKNGFRGPGSLADRITCRIKPGEAGNLNLIRDRTGDLLARKKGFEQPAGQWNEIALQLDEHGLKCVLNGAIVQDVRMDRPPPCRIALWARGFEIQYRNIRLYPADPASLESLIDSTRNEPAPPMAVAPPNPVPPRPPTGRLAPGTLIEEDFRNLSVGQLPRGWASSTKNLAVRRNRDNALELTDPTHRDHIQSPVNLSGDFAIDLTFAIPTPATSVVLHLQGKTTENMLVGVFGDGTVQVQVSHKHPAKTGALRPNAWNHLRFVRRGSKYSVELNGVLVGDIPINLGVVHFKSIRLALGPDILPLAARPKAAPKAKAKAIVVGRATRSPRIQSLRVTVPTP